MTEHSSLRQCKILRERVKWVLENAGFELVIDEENAFAKETETFGDDSISYDRYIAVGIKRKEQMQQQGDKTKVGSLRQKLGNFIKIGKKKP